MSRSRRILVVGGVAGLHERLAWWERRPLWGKTAVVTRTREQASQLTGKLAAQGAEVLEIPTIKIVPPGRQQVVAEAMGGLGGYQWLVFTSPNGVTSFFDYFFKAFDDLRAIGGVRIAAVGPATAAKLKELHLAVDAMPDKYVAKDIAKAIAEKDDLENLRVLLLRAEVANPELPKLLEDKGAIVDDVAVYQTVPETEDLNGAAARLQEEGADWVTFASSSAVENFHARFNLPALLKKVPGLRIASIGPETTKALLALGLKPTVEAKAHTIAGLVQAVQSKTQREA
jgi:uroporphyrinogen III methyltransferase/synthase